MQGLTRKRTILWFSATLFLSLFIGCATVPETGRRELMLIPERQELEPGHNAVPFFGCFMGGGNGGEGEKTIL
jgi:hypothetical protein